MLPILKTGAQKTTASKFWDKCLEKIWKVFLETFSLSFSICCIRTTQTWSTFRHYKCMKKIGTIHCFLLKITVYQNFVTVRQSQKFCVYVVRTTVTSLRPINSWSNAQLCTSIVRWTSRKFLAQLTRIFPLEEPLECENWTILTKNVTSATKTDAQDCPKRRSKVLRDGKAQKCRGEGHCPV